MTSSGTSEPSNSDVMNALTVSDVKNFGGLILAGLAVEEVKLIRDKSVKSEVIAAIGKIPPAELMPISHPEKLQVQVKKLFSGNLYNENVSA